MPAWVLLPAALLCIRGSLFMPAFYGSHSNNAGNSSLIYSNRCYNCTLMAPNKFHLIDSCDNDDACIVRYCRSHYSERVSHWPALQESFI